MSEAKNGSCDGRAPDVPLRQTLSHNAEFHFNQQLMGAYLVLINRTHFQHTAALPLNPFSYPFVGRRFCSTVRSGTLFHYVEDKGLENVIWRRLDLLGSRGLCRNSCMRAWRRSNIPLARCNPYKYECLSKQLLRGVFSRYYARL